jgi:UDP-N-acetylglucosamine--N-acetylmuramyl-(pentapeptide) pyrophosphoryl-undecaprenol N-acetylglucosamine transferase
MPVNPIDKTLAILAGGTGGHIYPALAVARQWQAQGGKVIWLGTQKGLEAKIVPANNIPLYCIDIAGIRGKSLLRKLSSPIQILQAWWQSLRWFRRLKPDVVLGMGGYVAGPAAIAAKCLRIPLVIHEQNSILGKTNKYLLPFANQVLQAFEGTITKRRVMTVGNPIRSDIAALLPHVRNVSGEPLNILVVGGSRGAKAMNELLPLLFSSMHDLQFMIKHQTGEDKLQETIGHYARAGVNAEVVSYIDDMAAAYAWADVLIARAGAMTVFEVMAAGIPTIFIPFPYAVDDHQAENANYLLARDAAYMVRERELSVDKLAAILGLLRSDQEAYARMSQCAYDLRVLDADKRIVQYCLEVVNV